MWLADCSIEEQIHVTGATLAFLDTAKFILYNAGFRLTNYGSRQNIFEWHFNQIGRVVQLAGWRGRREPYGDLLALLGIYDNSKNGPASCVFTLGVDDGTVEKHDKLLFDCTDYLNRIAKER